MALNTPTEKVFADSGAGTNGSPKILTSGSFTPSANALLACCVVENPDTAGDDPSVTITGGSLTWTRRARKNKNASSDGGAGTDGGAEIWTAVTGASPGSMTVTATSVNNFTTTHHLQLVLSVIEVTDGGGSVPVPASIGTGTSASGAPTANVSVSTGSYVLAVVSDWSANTGAVTYGSGQTSIRDGSLAGQVAWHFWRTTSTTSAGTQTMNMTAPNTQQYNECALEVQPPAGGAAVQPALMLLGVGS